MPEANDGPSTSLFKPLRFRGNVAPEGLLECDVSDAIKGQWPQAPTGSCVCWGIPFEVKKLLLIKDKPVARKVGPVKTQWLVFMHTADIEEPQRHKDGIISPMRGSGLLGEPLADYVIEYADGSEARATIRRRHQIGMLLGAWGEGSFEAVPHQKHRPIRPLYEQVRPDYLVFRPDQPSGLTDFGWPAIWGLSQVRVHNPEALCGGWTDWLWAWENPYPNKTILRLRFEPRGKPVVISAVSTGKASSLPLRWNPRRKAVLRLRKGETFDPNLDGKGLLKHVQLDMGQVISAERRKCYPNDQWAGTDNNQLPEFSANEVLIEYAAHDDARFHLPGDRTVPVSKLAGGAKAGRLSPVASATQRVRVRVLDGETGKPVAVKLHMHGEADEYLAPLDRHRIPNPQWFEDFGADFLYKGVHFCTYISGETTVDLPLGRVYVEVSKGLEIKPVRKVVKVTKATREIVLRLEKVLTWRERGWVTADTHVHFLSPPTAQLEGAAEGINVVNLLASQWGELMTNVGDFDGKTTFGSKEAGGDGEYLVRVGTENRQHVLGHISLLGYEGDLIAPMTTGGPDESALGDPIDALLMEWARQCKAQGGLVVLPHFPGPRAENAAALIEGDIDAVEMTGADRHAGINPYSLSDWYRYLNCGYFVPAVGGTDKMSACTPVGAVRTYARIPANRRFTYDAWMNAVRKGDTFATCGPLLECAVEGKAPGSRMRMKRAGGTVAVTWRAASVTMPMTAAELVVNGEIRERKSINPKEDEGAWTLKVDKSAWIAVLLRAKTQDRPEIIGAHSSPVMIDVEAKPFSSPADAVTILEQIEGALVYLDTVGTRAQTKAYKRMRLNLTAAYRNLHNQMHQRGHYHEHTPVTDHHH